MPTAYPSAPVWTGRSTPSPTRRTGSGWPLAASASCAAAPTSAPSAWSSPPSAPSAATCARIRGQFSSSTWTISAWSKPFGGTPGPSSRWRSCRRGRASRRCWFPRPRSGPRTPKRTPPTSGCGTCPGRPRWPSRPLTPTRRAARRRSPPTTRGRTPGTWPSPSPGPTSRCASGTRAAGRVVDAADDGMLNDTAAPCWRRDDS